MKLSHFIIIILLLGSTVISAQVAINIDGSAPASSAILDVKSTNMGFSPPKMTHAEMLAISSPTEGLMVFNSTYTKLVFFNGTIWINVDGTSCAEIPGAISGASYVCSGSTKTYSISAVLNATSYHWVVPYGSTISGGQGTTEITVAFGATSGNVGVSSENGCGRSEYNNLAVEVATNTLPQPGAISGNTFVSSGATETYSIASVSGATNYQWTVPTGSSITSGQGTTSISVNLGTTSGNVSVTAANNCGNSDARTLYVTIFVCGDVYTDTRDGSTYNTVSINGQCWHKENLNIGTMVNGSTVQTNNGTIEKYCFDNNTANCDTYGGLYQWDEMMQYSTIDGVQGICPDGWRIPTDAEWTTLTDYAGGLSVAGGKLKETGTTHWLTPNTGATNEYGFTNLPAGYHNSDGNFHFQTSISYSWSSTQTGSSAFGRRMHYQSAEVNHWSFDKQWGFSVRCIID